MTKRKTRERQLAKLAARRAAERRRRRRQRILATIIGVVLLLALVGGGVWFLLRDGGRGTRTGSSPSGPVPGPTNSTSDPCGYTVTQEDSGEKGPQPIPPLTIDENATYTTTIVTSMGEIRAELFAAEAPCTVNSFVHLARRGFFDGGQFHRVIKDFVIQGGDPTGTGSGGPGYSFNDELNNALTYEVGSLAMANSGANTNGSQFFIVTGQQGVELPKQYTIFGKVVDGLEVALEIQEVPTDADARPTDTVEIEEVTVVGP